MRRIAATFLVLVVALVFAATANARPAPSQRARLDAATTAPDQVIQWNQTLLYGANPPPMALTAS
ncbi:MAG TPA: hypothetical protein VHR88_09350 [Solirubrobacteraceae bacterium]|jgi:hypothetical protein|nr:hypothetical protein [Solirubrobacteraceae bacterium]